jgi:hypothetical protein
MGSFIKINNKYWRGYREKAPSNAVSVKKRLIIHYGKQYRSS